VIASDNKGNKMSVFNINLLETVVSWKLKCDKIRSIVNFENNVYAAGKGFQNKSIEIYNINI
jgi:hypothetical protein